MALEVRDLGVKYGQIEAVHGVSFEVPSHQVTSIVGPNGAGKSSIVRAALGLVKASGSVTLDGQSIERRRPHQRARAGISYVPDRRGVFPELTVKEHIRMAVGGGWEERWEQLVELFPLLGENQERKGNELSGGQQQTLSIARALANRPKYIVLDEPSIGLSPIAVKGVIEAVEKLSETGVGTLLAEQNAKLALSVSARVHVVVRGRIVRSAEPKELEGTDELRALYLGRSLESSDA
jgi:branched-chain amino acid transport system ATP-binding protein